jgi:hypothetical protein
VLDALADIPDEVDLRIAPVLAEITAARAAIEKATDRPATLTDAQIDELARVLADSCAAWSGRLVQTANRKSAAILLAILLGAVLAGGAVSWLAFGMPLNPVCVDIQGGGRICGAWTVPPPAVR